MRRSCTGSGMVRGKIMFGVYSSLLHFFCLDNSWIFLKYTVSLTRHLFILLYTVQDMELYVTIKKSEADRSKCLEETRTNRTERTIGKSCRINVINSNPVYEQPIKCNNNVGKASQILKTLVIFFTPEIFDNILKFQSRTYSITGNQALAFPSRIQ
jgi:hypothetical protein